jgi:hypothetical protein
MRGLVRLGLLIAGLALAAPAAAGPPVAQPGTALSVRASDAAFAKAQPSADARRLLGWISKSGDNLELPFLIVDKVQAKVFAFNPDGVLQGWAPALLGLGRGDISPAGIGQRRLADISPQERITPAGRFIAGLGNDLGEADILWVDYDSAISLHRVITSNSKDRRRERLASASTEDNRISYGCINVPLNFFDAVIQKVFNNTNGVVYILPEEGPLEGVFALPRDPARSPVDS